MNPSSNEMPGISLPPPVAGQSSGQAGQAAGGQRQAPVASPASLADNQPSSAAQPAPFPPSSYPHNDDTTTTKTVAPPLIDDNDKIEKEWVGKVRRIVEETRHDPHEQSEQLTRVKADYMQQRYNKVIKVEK